jgi:transcriptional regulator with XRE-family HTH domain
MESTTQPQSVAVPEEPQQFRRITLGDQIRAERLKQSLTLAKLAEQVNLTVSALSQIERGAGDPSISSLRRIATALRVPMFQLLTGSQEPEIVVRRDERIKVTFPSRQPEYELVLPDTAGDFSVLSVKLAPLAQTSADAGHHPSEECAIVVRGSITAEVGYRDYQLNSGDSIKIHRDMPHRFTNTSDEEAELIIVIAPAIF